MQQFYAKLSREFNSKQFQGFTITGNVNDLFYDGSNYVPLTDFIFSNLPEEEWVRVKYNINTGIQILDRHKNLDKISGLIEGSKNDVFAALSLLQQLPKLANDRKILIVIEGADLLFPNGEIQRLTDTQLRRLQIVCDWFNVSKHTYSFGVFFIASSLSSINTKITSLPYVGHAQISYPDVNSRLNYIKRFSHDVKLWSTPDDMAAFTAGLSLHTLRQLLLASSYNDEMVTPDIIIHKIESFIKSELGEDIIEFKKPTHTLKDVRGAKKLVEFIRKELIPRFKAADDSALPGAAVAGPIGGGKTFIFEAVAAELGLPVLTLKNIRSKWYGETDEIFEKLKNVLEALGKVVIFVDEADTQFGSLSGEEQSVERRLTGKIQSMMSDVKLRGKVIWLLMTARINKLSPDIRRPGRVGDLIIPVLDPEGEDRIDFIQWVVEPFSQNKDLIRLLDEKLPKTYSAASFSSLRSYLKAVCKSNGDHELDKNILDALEDQMPSAIEVSRRYQTLQALINCTRKSLLPNKEIDQKKWLEEIKLLEMNYNNL